MHNEVTVYQASVTRPGPPGGGSGLKTGDMLRAVGCPSENAVLGESNPAVPVYLLGPGSAGHAPGCITALVGLMSALDAPGAVALFARGWLHFSSLIEPDWVQVPDSPPCDLTRGRPGLRTSTIPSPTAAAHQAQAVFVLPGALALTSLSLPDEYLPHLRYMGDIFFISIHMSLVAR